MKNYIYIRYYHWLFIARLFKEHFSLKKESCVIICPKSCASILSEQGLSMGKDFVIENDLKSVLSNSSDSSVNFIIHHNDYSLNKFANVFYDYLKEFANNATLSFYADGFTNKFLKKEISESLIKTIDDVKLGKAYTFEIPFSMSNGELYGMENEVISSNLLTQITETPFLKENIVPDVLSIAKEIKEDYVCLMALRPWGSSIFQGGRFSFSDSEKKFENVIVNYIDEISNLTEKKDMVFLIRPDARDYDYTLKVAKRIEKEFIGKVIVLDQRWNESMTLDFFIAYFQMVTNKKLILTAFDSTVGHPYVSQKYTTSQFIGISEKSLRIFNDSDFSENLKKKCKSLINYVELKAKLDDELKIERINESYIMVNYH